MLPLAYVVSACLIAGACSRTSQPPTAAQPSRSGDDSEAGQADMRPSPVQEQATPEQTQEDACEEEYGANYARHSSPCAHWRSVWVVTRFGGVAPKPGETQGHRTCICDACELDSDCQDGEQCLLIPKDPCNPSSTPRECIAPAIPGSATQAARPCMQHSIPSARPGKPPAAGSE